MVTQLFLVQSFKVRVLVDQQKASLLRGFFYGVNFFKIGIYIIFPIYLENREDGTMPNFFLNENEK